MNSLLILGGARCVWNDVASLGVFDHDVAAVNDIGGRWEGPLVFWATLHPRKLARWEKDRKDMGYPEGYVRYSNKMGKPKIDKTLDGWGGSSGLFAVKVALHLGYENIILAGIPMETNQGHYFNNSGNNNNYIKI